MGGGVGATNIAARNCPDAETGQHEYNETDGVHKKNADGDLSVKR
jgi:hypothetical protein